MALFPSAQVAENGLPEIGVDTECLIDTLVIYNSLEEEPVFSVNTKREVFVIFDIEKVNVLEEDLTSSDTQLVADSPLNNTVFPSVGYVVFVGSASITKHFSFLEVVPELYTTTVISNSVEFVMLVGAFVILPTWGVKMYKL